MVRTIWRLRWLLRPHRVHLAIGSLLVVLVAAASVAAPWPLRIIVDNVLKRKPPSHTVTAFLSPWSSNPDQLLLAALVAMFAVVAVGAAADYLSNSILLGVGERVTATLRETLFSHLEHLSLTYHNGQRVGDLTQRVTGDVDYVQDMLIGCLSVLFPNVLVLVGMITIMFVADTAFASISLAIAPLLFASTYSYTRRIKRASKAARRKEGDVASLTSETLTSIRIVQAYTSEMLHLSLFRRRNQERLGAGLQLVDLQSQLSPLVDVIATIGTVLALGVGIRRVANGQLDLGLLLVFVAYISKLYQPMRSLSKLSIVLSRGQASAERLNEILDADARVLDAPGAVEAPVLAGEVRFEGVTFGYDGKMPVLADLSIKAAPGELVALTGLTGAGKSTLASLLARFYDPQEGRILIDGQDIRTFTVASLRRQVSLVLQESILFRGTIQENIAYGCEGATIDQIVEAARSAHVHEFIRRLPDGYDTIVSERGTTLSGGQRQRIAIARALVRDAPIVILDEPTSELDAISERYVMKGLEQLVEGRTVIVIAHRLSTLRRADRIFVLNKGRIVQSGTHLELLKAPGLYRALSAAQNGTSPMEVTSNGDHAGVDPDPESVAPAQNGTSPMEATSNGDHAGVDPDPESVAPALVNGAVRLSLLDHTTHGVDIVDLSGPAPEW
jgi:ATP-binding cassette, subfamily B, bacterial